MLLAFGWTSACPTHILEALSALKVCASTLNFANWNAAFRIRTILNAVFHEKLVKYFFGSLILDDYGFDHVIVIYVTYQIKPVNCTTLEWVVSLLAVKAKGEVAESTLPLVEVLFDMCQL